MGLPFVFWDAFGFPKGPSGILKYAEKLLESINSNGIYPTLLTKRNSFFKESTITIEKTQILKNLALRTKWGWSYLAYKQLLEELLNLRDGMQRGEAAIFHGLANTNLPLFDKNSNNFKYVLTVHDLIPILPHAQVSKASAIRFKLQLPKAVKKADRIICVSNWTYSHLVQRFPCCEAKTSVIPHGLGIRRQLSIRQDQLSPKVQLLFVSRWEVYKRFQVILDLLQRLPKNYCFIVVTDKKGRRFLELNGASFVCEKRLVIKSDLTERELERLYCFSDLYVHPSRYEGYGLPAVEALKNGTPIVYCKGHALDELIPKGCGFSLDAEDSIDDWVDVVKGNAALKKNSQFIEERNSFLSNSLSWNQAALATKRVYNTLI